jgi:hypothetical protein
MLIGKPEGKGSLGRPRRKWEYSIKIDLREMAGCCEDYYEPSGFYKRQGISCLAECTSSFARRTVLHGGSYTFTLNLVVLMVVKMFYGVIIYLKNR